MADRLFQGDAEARAAEPLQVHRHDRQVLVDGELGDAEGGACRPPEQRQGDSLRRSEEHTSELQSLMRISYAVFCLKKKIERTIASICERIKVDYDEKLKCSC